MTPGLPEDAATPSGLWVAASNCSSSGGPTAAWSPPATRPFANTPGTRCWWTARPQTPSGSSESRRDRGPQRRPQAPEPPQSESPRKKTLNPTASVEPSPTAGASCRLNGAWWAAVRFSRLGGPGPSWDRVSGASSWQSLADPTLVSHRRLHHPKWLRGGRQFGPSGALQRLSDGQCLGAGSVRYSDLMLR